MSWCQVPIPALKDLGPAPDTGIGKDCSWKKSGWVKPI